MQEMKASGVEWLGSIPQKWSLRRVGQLAEQIKRPNTGMRESNLLSLSYGKVKRRDINATEGLLPASFETYNIIEEDDIVLRFTDLQNDHKSLRVGRATERGIISSAYVTIRPSNRKDSKFIYYAMHAYDLRKGFYGMGAGVRQGLKWQEAKYIQLPWMPVEYRCRIVNYLDAKCSEIDRAIEAAEKSIEDYESYRDAIIFSVTTKGLNHQCEFQESNLEWLGEIPSSWNLRRWKYLLKERVEKNSPIQFQEILSLSAAQGVVPYSDRKGGGNKSKADLSEYKIARKGDIVLNSMNVVSGSVALSNYDGCVSPVYYMYYPATPEVDINYFGWLFKSSKFQRSLFGLGNGIMYKESDSGKLNTVRMRISSQVLASLKLPLPPFSEQQEIIAYLEERCSEIDVIISSKKAIIEDLKAYKQSLIYEVVTGKREV